eukprot:541713-Hanusia_phi.AAC.3
MPAASSGRKIGQSLQHPPSSPLPPAPSPHSFVHPIPPCTPALCPLPPAPYFAPPTQLSSAWMARCLLEQTPRRSHTRIPWVNSPPALSGI